MMNMFKAIVAAVTLLAVAVNPIAAMGMACCCTAILQQTRPLQQTRSCCQSAAQASSVEQRACSAKQGSANELIQHVASCCCAKVPPPSTSPRASLERPSVENEPLDVAFGPVDRTAQRPTSIALEHSPGRFTLSGPPLLALYCIWLK